MATLSLFSIFWGPYGFINLFLQFTKVYVSPSSTYIWYSARLGMTENALHAFTSILSGICWTKVVSLTVFCVLLTMLGTYSNRPDFWFRSLFWTTSMTKRKQNLNVENCWVWTPITVHTPWSDEYPLRIQVPFPDIVTSVLGSVSVSSTNFFFCSLLHTFYCSLFCCPQNLFIANHR